MTAKEAYLEYLKSDHWRQLRRAVIKRDGIQCTRCPAKKRLQAHHLFYRERWEDSVPEDLITLCFHCHKAAHGLVPVAQGPGAEIAGSVGNRRWNSRGQLVTRSGVPIVDIQRRAMKNKKNRQKKWVAGMRANIRSGSWSC